ncbi:MAG: YkgJ family cysteine cluster protein [Desulfotignum sp.]|jgi:hypothetical protein|nr:YkgJ family cysteine cluster protein [Desulfotignum sp.]
MIDRLRKIYLLYDKVMASVTKACRPKCAQCCTCNVTLTSLEARFMTFFLPSAQNKALYTRITEKFPAKRYIPRMTTNRFARLCMEGTDLPDEENDPSWGKCPLLANDLCTVYDVRPFGCRALMSDTGCKNTGFAQVPPWVLTMNNVFLQAIEHLDSHGFSGNLSDMLTWFPADEPDPPADRFVPNEAISVLMVPPGHRQDLAPVIEQLSTLLIPDSRP